MGDRRGRVEARESFRENLQLGLWQLYGQNEAFVETAQAFAAANTTFLRRLTLFKDAGVRAEGRPCRSVTQWECLTAAAEYADIRRGFSLMDHGRRYQQRPADRQEAISERYGEMLERRAESYVADLRGFCADWGLRCEWAPRLLHGNLVLNAQSSDVPLTSWMGRVRVYSFPHHEPSTPAPYPHLFDAKNSYLQRVSKWVTKTWGEYEEALGAELGWERIDTASNRETHLQWLFWRIFPPGMSYGAIADRWGRRPGASADDALTDSAVAKAVKRLADELQLTLPG